MANEEYKALLEIDQKERSFSDRQKYLSAYIWSVILPPIGIYYCIKFIFFANYSNEDLKAGLISLGLTLLSLFLSLWLMAGLFQSTTKNISPETNKFMQEMITPENQKSLQKLLL